MRRIGMRLVGISAVAGLAVMSLAADPAMASGTQSGRAATTQARSLIPPNRLGVTRLASPAESVASKLPSKATQIRVLKAVLRRIARRPSLQGGVIGGSDADDYDLGAMWKRGIDGAGTTVAVIEGWDYPQIGQFIAQFDKPFGLPNPVIKTIFPAGKLPKKCPPGMVKLGGYGSCSAWVGELVLDVASVHFAAPYAKIIISATPADTQITDDAASQVAPPEMMKAVEYIAERHLANVISISDGTGESSYSHGKPEILAQVPGELAAAAAGIPLLVATGDCGVVQNLPAANGQCEDVTHFRDTATWDDSPWVTAVGGTTPNLSAKGKRLGSDPLWNEQPFSSAAGFSKIFSRPSYQNGVARITRSGRRSVPDIVMDARDGTSEASPLLAGVLALATQLNHGNIGPINPALYSRLGPAGQRAGIVDVVHGNDSSTLPSGKVIKGFYAKKGFDVASGWGTIDAARFVPSLVAATQLMDEEIVARNEAAGQLRALGDQIWLSHYTVSAGGSTRLVARDFLPEHPVRLYIDGRFIRTLRANGNGVVRTVISLGALHIGSGQHEIKLTSMLLTQRQEFGSS
jgi:subtilase family serine protease